MVAPVDFPTADPFKPKTDEGQDQHLRQIASVVRGLMDGRVNSANDFSLEVSPAVTTTITDERIRSTSRIILTPGDDAAAAHHDAGTVRVLTADITNGSMVIRHLPSTIARTFRATFLS